MENKPILPNPPPNDPVLVETIDNTQSNPMAGFIGAALGAAVGAVLWAVIVYFTGFSIGFMAIIVGYLVGWSAVRLAGNGSMVLGIIAAVFAFSGTLAGNFLATAMSVAKIRGLGPLEILSANELSFVISSFTRNFDLYDLLFYGLAVMAAFRIANQQQTVINRVNPNG